ncbi:hypothetical protein PDIDSM_8320 [Penicillium digitatum]|nr:hypothetical protein PDIDSM_8320 [Penicillium digitatum]
MLKMHGPGTPVPVWRTTPTPSLFRDAGIPSGYATLEEAKLRFALRLNTIHKGHTLVRRIRPPMITRGRGTGTRQPAKTIIQRLGSILPENRSYRGIDKATASKAFQVWQESLPPTDICVFSDGSEQWQEGIKYVGYGFVLMVNGTQIDTGAGAINSRSCFRRRSNRSLARARTGNRGSSPRSKIWLCIDSTSVIWRATRSAIGMEAEPTISGIRSIFRELRNEARLRWWDTVSQKLSQWYRRWSDTYEIDSLPELELRRQRSTAGLPSARRMATSTGTTASSTTKTPNSTAHAAAESHQSTSLSLQNPEVFPTLAKTPPTPPTDRTEQSPTFAAWTPSSLLNYWSSQASTRGLHEVTPSFVSSTKSFGTRQSPHTWTPRDPGPHHDGRLTRRTAVINWLLSPRIYECMNCNLWRKIFVL